MSPLPPPVLDAGLQLPPSSDAPSTTLQSIIRSTLFVGAITFEAVTGRRSYSEIFGPGNALDHIKLAREASLFVVAPATADFIARAAHGHADDLLTACLLANVAPVLIVGSTYVP